MGHKHYDQFIISLYHNEATLIAQ